MQWTTFVYNLPDKDCRNKLKDIYLNYAINYTLFYTFVTHFAGNEISRTYLGNLNVKGNKRSKVQNDILYSIISWSLKFISKIFLNRQLRLFVFKIIISWYSITSRGCPRINKFFSPIGQKSPILHVRLFGLLNPHVK